MFYFAKKEKKNTRPSIVNAELQEKIHDKIRENHLFEISDLSLHFPKILRTVLFDVLTLDLGYHKFCANT